MSKINIAIIIMGILNIAIFTIIYFLVFHNYLPKKEYIPYQLPEVAQYFEITQEQAIALAKECVGISSFKIVFTDKLADNVLGNTNIFTRKINIRETLDPFYQLGVIVHEMVHIKYYTANERFTEFKTFQLMYESNNEIVHNVGIWYGQNICDNYSGEYDCSYFIVDYFQKNAYNIYK